MEQLAILGIGTAVPAFRLDQRDASSRIMTIMQGEPELARWANRIFSHCGVDTRYTCESNLLEPAERCRYVAVTDGERVPTTAERMALYRQASVPLATDAAAKALADSDVRPGEITHLLVASCTGMFLPGIDAGLAWKLDLPADVRMRPLTFLGCAAGLTALREAMAVVRGDPNAKVLVVNVELCSIHIQPSLSKEELFTAALFGDGASACVVGMTDGHRNGAFGLRDARAVRFPESEALMEWEIGDYGFRLRLSPRIPGLIGEYAPSAVSRFWGDESLPERWAIHPGGRGIVDAVQRAFRLSDAQTEASREILRDYGNMSSATILFVLDAMRRQRSEAGGVPADGIAVAFGPGVTAELLRFVLL